MKRATFLLLYFASGSLGRRTTLLRLGMFCLPFKMDCFNPQPLEREVVADSQDKAFLSFNPQPLKREVATGHQKRRRFDRGYYPQSLSDAYTRVPILFPFQTLSCESTPTTLQNTFRER